MGALAPELERDAIHAYPYGLGLEEFPFVLVLEAATMSAHNYVSSQRIAGFKVRQVAELFYQIVSRTKDLHGSHLLHFDLKLRNVLLQFGQGKFKVILCDLDAAVPIGQDLTGAHKLGSSAYFSPVLLTLIAASLLSTLFITCKGACENWP